MSRFQDDHALSAVSQPGGPAELGLRGVTDDERAYLFRTQAQFDVELEPGAKHHFHQHGQFDKDGLVGQKGIEPPP